MPRRVRIESKSLSSQVAHELICEVLRGAYVVGETLPTEEMLCARFGVSRPVVREAVKVLASLSMLRTRQGQGSVLLPAEHWNELAPELLVARCTTGTTAEVLAEVIELRSVLESRAAELAARRAGPKDLERLRAFLSAMRAAGDDREAFLHYDMQFHREILLIAGNLLVVKLFDLLEPMLRSARQLALEHEQHPEGMLRGIAEHAQILEALENSSPKAARIALQGHLSWVMQRVDAFGALHHGQPATDSGPAR